MVNKIKNASIIGALALSLGMLVSAPGYSHGGGFHGGGHGFHGGWHGGGWHGGGWHGGGWHGAGWGGGRWNNAGWYGGVGVLPVFAPFGGYGYGFGYNGCFVPGHRNYRGVWIPAHYRC